MRSAEQISRRLKLRHLNVLVAVVEQRSMAKAAQQLAVSQPVVSKAIADLENLVGARLLDRGPKGIEPTVYGRALLRRSIAMFNDLRAGISELEFLADPCAGELRIGTTEAFGTSLVLAIVDRLSRQYPRIVFDVTLADPGVLPDRELRSRRVDLIVGRFTLDVMDDLDVTVLYRDSPHIVAGATSPWARRRKIALAELTNERWVMPRQDHPIRSLIVDAFQRSGLQAPQSVVTVSSGTFTSRLLASGQFLGVLGAAVIVFNDLRASLKVLPVELPIPAWPVCIVTLKGRTPPPAAKLFLDCAQELARPLANVDLRRRTRSR